MGGGVAASPSRKAMGVIASCFFTFLGRPERVWTTDSTHGGGQESSSKVVAGAQHDSHRPTAGKRLENEMPSVDGPR
jgi:hypothetical protein